ncbi:MAG TPA: DUF1622 domain-containing protein [Longimicrobium sp.]|nr:DUF1622 domain-containing protein [Longimicrobium sp.]
MQTGAFERAEAGAQALVRWLELAIEALGAAVIAAGIVFAVVAFVRAAVRPGPDRWVSVRLTLAHYLALALEFLLAADILATAISPTWDQIGKLAAIAAIRTGLNFFLMREMKEETRDRPGAVGEGT